MSVVDAAAALLPLPAQPAWAAAYMHGSVWHFVSGVLLKVADDAIDDGLYPKWAVPLCIAGVCYIWFGEMLRSVRLAVMMGAFTVACWETGGVDTPWFSVPTIGVALCFAAAMWNAPWAQTDFHLQQCFMATAYSGTLATRANDLLDERFGFWAKTAFRLFVGVAINTVRVHVPLPYAAQHDFLMNFTMGYFGGVVLSIPARWRARRCRKRKAA
eukprot:TRINITY_DN28207_c0_g1_i5.p2 TRINITY_DN28207_c0_g1~~TRINITY_DN28207_c0_g1_i5.p2  ORF type:complete len:241 (+),score=88.09 TRINITY_DN28207_c0_g1_i5:82-723(+)